MIKSSKVNINNETTVEGPFKITASNEILDAYEIETATVNLTKEAKLHNGATNPFSPEEFHEPLEHSIEFKLKSNYTSPDEENAPKVIPTPAPKEILDPLNKYPNTDNSYPDKP
jgi:hypothetical protein